MDTGERLAAYLSGDLDPDERTALEAQLAGDPELRAHLERIRASDQALVALPEPDLPEGFSDRLRERLAPELDAVLGDELAARRARRGTPRWLPAAGAAAVLALVVAGGVGLTLGGSGEDDASQESADTMQATGGEADAGLPEDAPEAAMAGPAEGPVMVDRGRSLTLEDLAALPDEPEVQDALASEAIQLDPAGAAKAYAQALGGSMDVMGDTTATSTEDAGSGAAAGDEEQARQSATVTDLGAISDEDRAAVGDCLHVLSEGAAAPVVPVFVELATDEEGEPVIVYVAVSPDREGAYQRLEIWMVDRETCDVRDYVQSDPQPVERTAP